MSKCSFKMRSGEEEKARCRKSFIRARREVEKVAISSRESEDVAEMGTATPGRRRRRGGLRAQALVPSTATVAASRLAEAHGHQLNTESAFLNGRVENVFLSHATAVVAH